MMHMEQESNIYGEVKLVNQEKVQIMKTLIYLISCYQIRKL